MSDLTQYAVIVETPNQAPILLEAEAGMDPDAARARADKIFPHAIAYVVVRLKYHRGNARVLRDFFNAGAQDVER